MDALKGNIFYAAAALLGVVAAVMYLAIPENYGLIPLLVAAIVACVGAVRDDPRKGAMWTAVVCLASNAYLFWGKLAATGKPSACSINATFDCDVVNNSQYSMFMDAFPVTLLGIAFYAGLIVAAASSPERHPRFHQVNGLFALVSLAYSAFLGWASLTLGAWCLVCLTIYAGNAVLLWSALRGLSQEGGSLTSGLAAVVFSNSVVKISMVFILVLFAGWAQWDGRISATVGDSASGEGPALSSLFRAPDGPIELSGNEPVLGSPDAPYMVVEWADFNCPHCKDAGADLKELVARQPDVQVRFKPFPLTSMCNPSVERDQGLSSCNAAIAAECAHQQGKFWEMTETLFKNQHYFEPQQIRFMATEVGLDTESFAACIDRPEILETVKQHAIDGEKAGIRGTPAIYLKGTHGADFIAVNDVEALITLLEQHRGGATLPPPGG
jgi:protein-disulfide isomerase/uncharacterized membrane protein